MATKATLAEYLNGYPQLKGNHKEVAAILNGPTDYDAGGVGVPNLKHVVNLVDVRFISTSALYAVYAVVNSTNPYFKYSNILLFFIDVATGLQPADNTDLSAIKVRMIAEGTN